MLRALRSRRDIEQASALYREAFGYDEQYSLNVKLMRGIAYAGGVSAGAWTLEDELVGFVFGFPGVDGATPYLYSQAACVIAGWRGRGLGTTLKHLQFEQARARGLHTMRWAFDPANVRNARINLDRLGARARWFIPDFYDDTNSDRLIVEWRAGSDRKALAASAIDPSAAVYGLPQPLENGQIAITVPLDRAVSPHVRAAMNASLRDVLDAGGAAISCPTVTEGVAAYVCEAAA